jgi:drug/metabolite transporter (DMT)-like permease
MLYLLFGICSSICFGISNAYWKKAIQRIEFPYLVFYRGLIVVFVLGISWAYLLIFPIKETTLINYNIDATHFLASVLLCFFSSLGLVYYLRSIEYTPISLVTPISAVNFFSILTAIFILGEKFKYIHFYAILLSITGILLALSINFRTFKLAWNKGATYAVMASFFWGISYTLFKFTVAWLGVIPFSFLLEFCVSVTAMVWHYRVKKSWDLYTKLCKDQLIHYLILAILLLGGTLFYNLALQHLSMLTLNIIGPLQTVITIGMGIFFYKEHLTIRQFIGILLILSAVSLVSFLG